MRLDQFGIDFIKLCEGFKPHPYLDAAGVWTIGYGHTHSVTQHTPNISEAGAHELFLFDVRSFEWLITKEVSIPLTQNEFNALVSFTFNLGNRALLNSTLLQRLNNGDKKGASKEFGRWVYCRDPETQEMRVSRGLQERREKERVLFLLNVSEARSA